MNGEALTRRYEVRDADTGEIVEGPCYVLRPREDDIARSALFVYGALCGIEDELARALFRNPKEHPADDDLLLRAIQERLKVPENQAYGLTTATLHFSQLEDFLETLTRHEDFRSIGKELEAGVHALGFEPVRIACRALPDEEREHADRVVSRLRGMRRRREQVARQTSDNGV